MTALRNEAEVHTVATAAPDDVSGLVDLFDRGVVDPAHIVALIAQTEGDGFARGYAALSLVLMLSQRLGLGRDEIEERIPMLMIGGTAGLMSPHVTLFVNKPSNAECGRHGPRLAIGVSRTRVLQPEEYGTPLQVGLVAEAVRRAMRQAGLASAEDVVCVELKTPMLSPVRLADARARGVAVAGQTPRENAPLVKGAAALGAAIALGEIDEADLTSDAIERRSDLFSTRASVSAGLEQSAISIVVVGNSDQAPGRFKAGGSVMADQLDLAGARAAFTAAGLRLDDGVVADADRSQIAAVFVNAGANAVSSCRGHRHTMNTDFLSQYAGHMSKAVAHATVAAIAQTPLILASAGAEHQGPPGANLVCVIARARED